MNNKIEKAKIGLGMFCSVCILTMFYLITTGNPEELITSMNETDKSVNVVFSKDEERNQVLVCPDKVVEFENITIEKTTVQDYEVTFDNHSGIVEYTFYVENKSARDAVLQEYKLPNPVCKGFQEDCEKVLVGLNYTLLYEDGAPLQAGDIIRGREKKKVILTIEYIENENELPSSTTDISNLGFSLDFLAR